MRIPLPFLFLLPVLALAETAAQIDWDKAKALHQRASRGEALTPDEQKYYELAKAELAAGRGPGGRPSADESDPEMRRAKAIWQRKQAGETISAEDEKVLAEAMRRRGGGNREAKRSAPPAPPQGLVPLSDPKASYRAEDGGLYGGGRNEPPADLATRAAEAAQRIQPIDASGKPSADGKIVLMSIGMSNTTQEFSTFKRLADADSRKAANVVIVDAAQGGKDAPNWRRAAMQPWEVAEERLRSAGVTPAQVQAVWIKQAIAGPREGWPAETDRLREYLGEIVGVAQEKFPNLRLVFLSSRTYAGYATTSLNPEPYAYESAFAVRKLIAGQKPNGLVLLWGPYLWADGAKPREGDGFHYTREDFGQDGTHPSRSGQQKVAEQLLGFFTGNTYAKSWFVRR